MKQSIKMLVPKKYRSALRPLTTAWREYLLFKMHERNQRVITIHEADGDFL